MNARKAPSPPPPLSSKPEPPPAPSAPRTRTVTEQRWGWWSPRYGVWLAQGNGKDGDCDREALEQECDEDETVIHLTLTYTVPEGR